MRMSTLISKNDFKEFICKFKGHVAREKDIQLLQKNGESFDARCEFGINLRKDSEDGYYIITEL